MAHNAFIPVVRDPVSPYTKQEGETLSAYATRLKTNGSVGPHNEALSREEANFVISTMAAYRQTLIDKNMPIDGDAQLNELRTNHPDLMMFTTYDGFLQSRDASVLDAAFALPEDKFAGLPFSTQLDLLRALAKEFLAAETRKGTDGLAADHVLNNAAQRALYRYNALLSRAISGFCDWLSGFDDSTKLRNLDQIRQRALDLVSATGQVSKKYDESHIKFGIVRAPKWEVKREPDMELVLPERQAPIRNMLRIVDSIDRHVGSHGGFIEARLLKSLTREEILRGLYHR